MKRKDAITQVLQYHSLSHIQAKVQKVLSIILSVLVSYILIFIPQDVRGQPNRVWYKHLLNDPCYLGTHTIYLYYFVLLYFFTAGLLLLLQSWIFWNQQNQIISNIKCIYQLPHKMHSGQTFFTKIKILSTLVKITKNYALNFFSVVYYFIWNLKFFG